MQPAGLQRLPVRGALHPSHSAMAAQKPDSATASAMITRSQSVMAFSSPWRPVGHISWNTFPAHSSKS